jgi:DNA-binding beta-propeller fold protein YncE
VACALILLRAATAHALFLPLGTFGSQGSGADQFQTPKGVAVDQASGDVYVADTGNARVEKFDAQGNFIAAWGWGVADGTAQSEVCTSGCQAGIPGSGAGQFSNPTSVAVDSSGGPSAGDVYVGDNGNNVVLKFDANGNFLSTIDGSTTPQGPYSSLVGVAVDQSGNLWTADGSSDNVTEFDDQGNFLQQWNDTYGQTIAIAVDSTNNAVYLIRGTQATERWTLTGSGETVIDGGQGVALGVDPATGNLFVDHSSDVTLYDNTGTQIDSITLVSSSSQGLAYGSTAGALYASDSSSDQVTIYGPPTNPSAPLVASESATNVTESTATLNATIVPFGLDTTCEFQYVDDADFQATGYATATSVPCTPADLGSSFGFQSASANVSGLTSATTYHFRAVATNSDGTTNGADRTFTTAGPPVVQSESATGVTDATATLNATIVPVGFDTTCQFQYVDDADFQATGYASATTVDCSPADLGSGFTAQTTSASVTGLTPGTTYHFRAVATNAAATTNGQDETLQTLVSFLRQVGSFGSTGSGADQFQTPLGVAVDPQTGEVYVADAGNARVEKFDSHGNFVAAWGWGVRNGKPHREVCKKNCQAGIPGSGRGQFSFPTTIAVGSRAHHMSKVYVGDAGNNTVSRFSIRGHYAVTIDGSAAPQGKYSSLAGVAVDQSGNVWTADGGTNNVDEFDQDGHFLQEWNDANGSVRAIAVDATNNAVYLMDAGGATHRFTLTGTGAAQIDSGSGVALAVEPGTGTLYVDHGNNVVVYNPTGAHIDQLFSLGATTNSQGLAYSHGAISLYVADASNNSVTIYGAPPAGLPFITSESATGAGPTSETLKAAIVPLGSDTTCHFQYVDAADFQATGYAAATTVPCTPADLGLDFAYHVASAPVNGLTVGALYHFRVIATNDSGTATGVDQTLQAGPKDWTPFSRCPVDDPAMIATDGGITKIALCLASHSTHGSITIGTTSTMTGISDLQAGLVLDENTSIFTVVPPAGGALISDPAQVTVGPLTITAVVESAGAPSNFDLGAGLGVGQPIITIPVKIHLENPALGPSCYLGSDQDPILLQPENTDISNVTSKFENFDPDGTPDPNGPLELIQLNGAVQGDDTFAVPGAQGCGPNGDGSLDSLVDAASGLPSPAGSNHLVLDDASSSLAALVNGDGQQFANDWHLAFGP